MRIISHLTRFSFYSLQDYENHIKRCGPLPSPQEQRKTQQSPQRSRQVPRFGDDVAPRSTSFRK